jgi:YidC/Oxa1 family membrane protein insertase
MGYLYYTFFYQPLFNILIFFYQTVAFHDLGLAIVFLTLLIRLILFPVFQKSVRNQTIMQQLQPKLEKIKKDHKKDPIKQSQATMDLYREHRINPFSGFLFLLIQLPILIALYQIFKTSVTGELLHGLYSFIQAPREINTYFLNLIHLDKTSIILVGLAALTQYIQARLSLPKQTADQSFAGRMGRQMLFIGPVITLVFLWYLPAAIGLYWLTTTAFSIFQQIIVNRQLKNGKLGIIYKETN